jgi:hypothetical protein
MPSPSTGEGIRVRVKNLDVIRKIFSSGLAPSMGLEMTNV